MDTIEHSTHATVFSGREAVEVFRLAVLASALKLEMKGLRMSRRMASALAVAKRTTGLRTNDRAVQLARILVMIENAKRAVVHVERDEVQS